MIEQKRKQLPKIRITSNKKEGTKIYQDDIEIKLVTGYSLSQIGADKMPMLVLEMMAPEVEIEIEECEVEDKEDIKEN